MRRYLLVAVVLGLAGRASAERLKSDLRAERPVIAASCKTSAGQLITALRLDAATRTSLERRCDADKWSLDAKMCFSSAESSTEAALCLDTLSKTQRKAVEGDADRLADGRFARWLARPTLAPMAGPQMTLVSFHASQAVELEAPPAIDLGRTRALEKQAMSAYQHGDYDTASKSFDKAMVAAPTADNVYFAAQAARMKGNRARAIELYERYLQLAPNGPAAPACRFQLERLRDSLP